jgi:hypothetical protein
MSADPTPGDDAAGDRGLGRRGRKLLATMPHIIAYPGADYVLAPYVNCALRPGMDTGTIRADAYGYRVTHDPHGIVDSRTWLARPRRALALGNSFLLGWCCSGDAATIPSYLSAKTPYSFLNLGLAGASSLQETIAGIPFLDQAELVVIISGIGNVQHYLEHTRDYDLYGAFFSQHLYLGTSQTPVRQLSALHQQDTSADVELARERLARHAAAHAVPKQQWSAAEVRERHDLAVQHHFRDLRLVAPRAESWHPSAVCAAAGLLPRQARARAGRGGAACRAAPDADVEGYLRALCHTRVAGLHRRASPQLRGSRRALRGPEPSRLPRLLLRRLRAHDRHRQRADRRLPCRAAAGVKRRRDHVRPVAVSASTAVRITGSDRMTCPARRDPSEQHSFGDST